MNNDFQAEMARFEEATTSKSTERRTVRKRKKKVKKTNIEGNPFHDVIVSEPNRNVQREKFTELMTFTDSETAKANKEAMVEFDAWLQEQRQDMASELIEMNDTSTFSNLQLVLKDINGDLIDFEDRIKPFLEIINAVRTLQEGDLITDTIREIEEQAAKVEALQAEKREVESKISSNLTKIKLLDMDKDDHDWDIKRYSKQRKWFGLGDITEEAKVHLAALKTKIEDVEKEQGTYGGEIEKLKAKAKELTEAIKEAKTFGELAEEKAILAKMLDMNSAEHEEKHRELIGSATKFVDTTKERIGDTLEKSLGMSGHIEKLSDVSYNIRGTYQVLATAAQVAEKNNADLHETLKDEAGKLPEEDALGLMENEEQQRELTKYIAGLSDVVSENSIVLNDLTIASQRIETMQDANNAQIKKTRSISTSGIAGVADNLSSVLTSIGQTAVGQAATAAQQSLRRMNETTIGLTKEQMLNQAKARNDVNADLVRNLENLAGFGEVIDIANSQTYETISQTRELVEELRTTAEDVQASVKDGVDIQAQVIADNMD